MLPIQKIHERTAVHINKINNKCDEKNNMIVKVCDEQNSMQMKTGRPHFPTKLHPKIYMEQSDRHEDPLKIHVLRLPNFAS